MMQQQQLINELNTAAETAPYLVEKLLISVAQELLPIGAGAPADARRLFVDQLLDKSGQLHGKIQSQLHLCLQSLTGSQISRIRAALLDVSAAHTTTGQLADGHGLLAVLSLLDTCVRHQRIHYDNFSGQCQELRALSRSLYASVVAPFCFSELALEQQRAFLLAVSLTRELELFCAVYSEDEVAAQPDAVLKEIWRGRWRVASDHDALCSKLALRTRSLRVRWQQEQQPPAPPSSEATCALEQLELLYLPAEECLPRQPATKRPRVHVLSEKEAGEELARLESAAADDDGHSAELLAGLASLLAKDVRWPADATHPLVGVARRLMTRVVLAACVVAVQQPALALANVLTPLLGLCGAALGPARALRLLPVPLSRRVLLCCAVAAAPPTLRALTARPLAELVRGWAGWLSALVLSQEALLAQSPDLVLTPVRRMLEAALDCECAELTTDWSRLAMAVDEALGRLAHRLATSERRGRLCKAAHLVAATYAQALTRRHVPDTGGKSDSGAQAEVRRAAQSVVLTLLDGADAHLLQQTRIALKATPKEILKQLQREHELFRKYKGHV